MNTSQLKQQVRTAMRRRLRAVTEAERTQASEAVAEAVCRRPEWQHARRVLLFASLPDEVDTTPLLRRALEQDKEVLLPRVVGADLELYFYAANSLQAGAYGILEPTAAACRLHDVGSIELALIPGLAFTPQGDRLGRGKGFYDRLLPRLACPKLGIGYPFQQCDMLPVEPHDSRLTGFITCEETCQ